VREEDFIHALCLSYIVNVFPLCFSIVVSLVLYTFLLSPGICIEMKKDVTYPNSNKIELSLVLDRIVHFCEGVNAFLDIITSRKVYTYFIGINIF
jgi:hypothetical protein